MRSKGRTPPIYRPGVNKAGEVTIPACDLTTADGVLLYYTGTLRNLPTGGGVYLTLTHWSSLDGLKIAASLDPLPHQSVTSKRRFLHVSVSRADRLPTWAELVDCVEAIAGSDLDMAMIKPRRSDYINVQEYTLHLVEMPVEWGIQ